MTACHAPVRVGIRTFDVEQHEIDVRQVAFVGTIPQKPRGLNGRVQAHCLRSGKYPTGEFDLHHRFAAGNGEPPTERTQRRREIAQTAKHLFGRNVSPILQMPRIRIVTVRTTQQAAGHKEHNAQPRPVISGRGFVGVTITERALLILELAFVGRVG